MDYSTMTQIGLVATVSKETKEILEIVKVQESNWQRAGMIWTSEHSLAPCACAALGES